MSTEQLFEVLTAIYPISGELKKAVEKVLTPLSLPRNYLLLEAPKVSEHAYFLNDGFAMSYIFVNSEKKVECFWKSGQVIVSATSFFEQVPSHEFIQLRDNSQILCINYSDVLKLFDSFPESHFIYRVIMNRYCEHSKQRTRDMKFLTAIERYEKLIRNFPLVERLVTQEDIASYLGISPQSFCRIKRRKR